LIGTTYGGDGRVTFALPDFRGRVPIHQGRGPHSLINYYMGSRGGYEKVPLSLSQIPSHTHVLQASSDTATTADPEATVLAKTPQPLYLNENPATSMYEEAIGSAGGDQFHENMQPSMTIRYIIAVVGEYPPRP
jgi:microcystin-dependent protein